MSEPLTDAELDAIEALIKDASPAPWAMGYSGWSRREQDDQIADARGDAVIMAQDEQGGSSWGRDEDARLIVASRNALPRLLAEVRRLRAAELLDERDKRPRVDADGGLWEWVGSRNLWWCQKAEMDEPSLAMLDQHFGPLSFAPSN